MKKLLIGLLLIGGLLGGALSIAGTVTKNQGSELAMAVDNVNPLVKTSTVYGLTNQAVSHGKGQMGEDVYTYRMRTVDAAGHVRWLTFTADHRLKRNYYLQIETKGQNVNSWQAVTRQRVPNDVQRNLKQTS